jgi:serine/threonine protein kinase
VAIKIIAKNTLQSRPAMQQKLEREIAIMKFLDHPNVLRLYDVYDTPNYLFLVLEHVEGGELFDYLLSKKVLPESEALRFFQELVDGVEYCHEHLICHRDLKPENILLDGNMRVKICDFGMAALMPKDALLATSCGSPHYASPEVITGRKYNGMEADVWSLGVILYALLVGKLPFDDPNMRKLLLKVKIGVFEMPPHLDKTAKDLLWRMLTVDPEKRAKLSEIKQHPWFLSNGGPVQQRVPSLDVDKVVPFSSEEELDPEVVQTLTALWGDEQAVLGDLIADGHNLTKVFYRLVQKRFEKRSEEEKAAAAPPPEPEPEPEPEPPSKSFRALARRSISFFRPNSPGPSPAAVTAPATSDEQEDSTSTSPKSPDDALRPSLLARRSSSQPVVPKAVLPNGSASDAGAALPSTPERPSGLMRRMSLVRVKSPMNADGLLDHRFFTTSAPDARTEASSPLTLSGASPRKSWFHFFSRGSSMKSLNRSDAPPLARAVMTTLTTEEAWGKAQPLIEELDVGLRFSKTLRCLKATYPSGEVAPAAAPVLCKFFVRMTSLVAPGGAGNTYLHWEFRSGSQEEFLALFTRFGVKTKDWMPVDVDTLETE